jgi:LytS/YehU family sensor histidine kinase
LFALSSVLAIGSGIAGSFAAWLIQRSLGVPALGRMGLPSAAITAQSGAFDGLVGLGLWAVAIVIPHTVREANARALEAARLHTAAELARLRANLQPHFLFNTLSTIAGLVAEDPHAARELIGALGDLLRDSLEDGDDMQTVDDEVAWLRRYAAILEIRHRGTLTFHWDVAQPARGVRIPRLLLQPLLENAVKHGALRRREGGEVSVRAAVDGTRLTCIVEDNGPGPVASEPRDGARGIELVERRLEIEYVGAAAFRLEADGSHTRSIVELPVEAP